MKPLVSIITVVFNDKNIIKTIESIIPFLMIKWKLLLLMVILRMEHVN